MRELFGNIDIPKGDEHKIDDPNKERSVACHAFAAKFCERRVKSELHLEEALPWHMEEGMCYHCFSYGDVDSLSYLRMILKQQRVEYAMLSTWAMATTDVAEIAKFMERGDLGRMDFYVGDSFKTIYSPVYVMLSELCSRYGGRVAIFRNHSKCLIGFGERFDFAVVGSANFNTNPRCECVTISVDSPLARWYKEECFDKIQSFTRDFDGWKPYKLKRDETF